MTPHRILVVANQTACSDELLALVAGRSAAQPTAVTLLVPATHASEQLVWTEGNDRQIAQRRLDAALERFRSEGIEAEGCVGDANPVLAAADLMIDREFDEIILSTLPPGLSRWLKLDVRHRFEQRFRVPVTTVIGHPVIAP